MRRFLMCYTWTFGGIVAKTSSGHAVLESHLAYAEHSEGSGFSFPRSKKEIPQVCRTITEIYSP